MMVKHRMNLQKQNHSDRSSGTRWSLKSSPKLECTNHRVSWRDHGQHESIPAGHLD